MRGLKKIFILFFSFILLFFAGTNDVSAGDDACTWPKYPKCYNTRIIYQWACSTCPEHDFVCAGNTNINCEDHQLDRTWCSVNGYGGPCVYLCTSQTWLESNKCENTGYTPIACNVSQYNCGVTVNLTECQSEYGSDKCILKSVATFLSCCGGSSSTPTPYPTSSSTPSTPTPTPSPSPSCSVLFNSPTYDLGLYNTTNLGINLNVISGTVSSVGFISSDVGKVSVNPPLDRTSPYTTTARGVSAGSSTVTANVVMSGSVRCSATAIVYVTGPSAWWQVQDSDILANGNLNSSIPTSLYFNLIGPGGFPGVPAYRDSTNLTADNVSVTKWLVNSFYHANRVYNSGYFMNLIPSDVSENASFDVQISSVGGSYFEDNGLFYNGYKWFMYDGSQHGGADLTIDNSVNLGSTKVILFVKNANLNISNSINLTDGSGFFLAITTGNISVDQTLGGGASANMEGIYIADGTFSSGTGGTKTDSRLWVRGSVAAYGGVSLQRDLGDASNSTTPSEFFEYAPDQELLFPIELAYRAINWKEVAP